MLRAERLGSAMLFLSSLGTICCHVRREISIEEFVFAAAGLRIACDLICTRGTHIFTTLVHCTHPHS